MSGELHQISAAIGGLQAQVQEHGQQLGMIAKKLNEIAKSIAIVPTLVNTVEEIEPIVRALETDRVERNARILKLSGGTGTLGALLVEALTHLGHKFGWF